MTNRITGALAVLRSIECEGLDCVFGYPGGAIMPVYDAMQDEHLILRHILVRHEQGAVHAAEGYARMTGNPGVCIATSGPGATNLITGIADAMLDSVPLVCITGQVASHLLGTDAFQEADIIGMTIPVTKWNYQITRAEEIPAIMAKAFYLAKNGRPGPVLIDVTKDAQFGLMDFAYHKHKPKKAAYFPAETSLLLQAAELINKAKKPYILAGHGVTIAKAEQALLNFVEKTKIPVACTLLGLSAFPTHHPLYAGLLGMHGNYGANVLTNEADVIIAIGMRFDDRVTGDLAKYARGTKIIHIDIDPVEIDKHMATTVALISDAKVALEALLPHVNPNAHEAWLKTFHSHNENEHYTVIAKELYNTNGPIKMAEAIHKLGQKTKGEAVVVTDVGQHQMVAARYYPFARNNSHITSGGAGTMGFALPAAIGAKLATPDREVVVIAGDGGFQMNIQELGVIAQEGLKVKMIILNNSFLGMVRQWQELFFNERYSFTQLKNPDFIKIAQAYDIPGRCVSDRDDLDGALDEMLKADSAYLLEIKVEKQENIFPMIPSGAGVGEMRLF